MHCASSPRRLLTIVAFALLTGVAPTKGRAAIPTAVIRYEAPPECPGPSRFLSLLEARSAGRWRARQTDRDPDFIVEIRNGVAGKVGRVRRGGRPGEGSREIASTDCDDLVQALALSTALSLDDDISATSAAGPVIVARPTAPQEAPGSSWIVGGGAANTFLLPSQAMPAASLFVENGRRLWASGLGIQRPDLRLALSYARNDLFGADRARFTLSDAGLTICPVGVGLGERSSLRICGSAEVGMLSGEGIAVGSPRMSRFLWAAAGAVARLRWAPGGRMIIEAHAGLVAPFERTTFIFEVPRVEVATVPALVAAAGLTVGLTIP